MLYYIRVDFILDNSNENLECKRFLFSLYTFTFSFFGYNGLEVFFPQLTFTFMKNLCDEPCHQGYINISVKNLTCLTG